MKVGKEIQKKGFGGRAKLMRKDNVSFDQRTFYIICIYTYILYTIVYNCRRINKKSH